jgi:hypothetical protein
VNAEQTIQGFNVFGLNNSLVDMSADPLEADVYFFQIQVAITNGLTLQVGINAGGVYDVYYPDNTPVSGSHVLPGEVVQIRYDDISTCRRTTKPNSDGTLVSATGTAITFDPNVSVVALVDFGGTTDLMIDPTMLKVGKIYTVQALSYSGSYSMSISVSSGQIYGILAPGGTSNFYFSVQYESVRFYSDAIHVYLVS